VLSKLPSVHALADAAKADGVPRWAIVEAARALIAAARAAGGGEIEPAAVTARARALALPGPHPVINATGVVLHTNLGRAPLSVAARSAIDRAAAGYSDLEYDLTRGARGSRHDHLRFLLTSMTGAADACVVNNNAAATVLGLAALATGKEIIVSRGELIEIGGSFRLPDVLALSRGVMIEVGTTNKTHVRDYADAIGPNTGLLLKVHRSNFAMVGFTADVTCAELAALGKHRGIPTMVDLGSGALIDRAQQRAWGLPDEPTVAETIAAGPDLVTFSGDKLLGGPQAGIAVGTAAAIAQVRTHPLMRALRPDKLALAALGATLAAYRDGDLAAIPTLRMLALTGEALRATAGELAAAIGAGEVAPCMSTVGGGTMPTAELPSWAVALPEAIEPALRRASIVARIEGGRVWLDVRTIAPDELGVVAAAVRAALV